MRTLIVEDEEGIQQLIKIFLKSYSNCITALDGQEAVVKFQTALEQKRPFDLILLDIMMPIMDGMEALEKIREIEQHLAIPEYKGVKVIMLTARDDTAHVLNSFRHRCDAYLVKPFDGDELLNEIEKLNIMDAT